MARSGSRTSLPQLIDPVLRPLGFTRCKSLWNRKSDGFVEAIEIQRSTGNTSFTLNVGVLDPTVYEIIWRKPTDSFVEAPYCSVYTRIGSLIGQYDVWWDYSDLSAPETVKLVIQESVIPFLERMRSLSEQSNWIGSRTNFLHRFPGSSIHRAIIEFKLGNRDIAREILTEIATRSLGDWKFRAREIALQLGLGDL